MLLLGDFIVKANLRKEQETILAATQSALTSLYEEEVQESIKEYWIQSGSVETLKNPNLVYKIASGQLADDLYSSHQKVEYQQEPYMTVTKSVDVTEVLVLEYSTSRFKAIACCKLKTEGVKPDGTVIQPNVFAHSWIFVFIREDEKWKALGYLSRVYPNAYEESPEWLQQVIGEMPNYYDGPRCGTTK